LYAILLAFFSLSSVIGYSIFKSKILYQGIVRVYVIVECICFSAFFYYLYKKNIAKKIILYSAVPLLLFCFFNLFMFFRGNINNNTLIIEFLFFILAISYYFFEKMKVITNYPIYQSISFWICVGLFIYFTGNFFYLIFATYSTEPLFVKQMKLIYTIVAITKDIILSFAWFAHERQETSADIIKLPDGLGLDDDLPFLTKTNL
jgi:hypothetical protein